jgi:hypothetical protein
MPVNVKLNVSSFTREVNSKPDKNLTRRATFDNAETRNWTRRAEILYAKTPFNKEHINLIF